MEELYIDEQEALKRVGGSKKLYIRLLKKYLEDSLLQNLEGSLALGDMKNAQLVAHSIKGVAANLSLTKLYYEATKVDAMLKNDFVDPYVLQEFKAIFEKTNSAIEGYLNSEDT